MSEPELWHEWLDLRRGFGLGEEPRDKGLLAPALPLSCFCGVGSLLRLGGIQLLLLPSACCQGDFLLELPGW